MPKSPRYTCPICSQSVTAIPRTGRLDAHSLRGFAHLQCEGSGMPLKIVTRYQD